MVNLCTHEGRHGMSFMMYVSVCGVSLHVFYDNTVRTYLTVLSLWNT